MTTRDISTLYNMDSYQDMTDEEIEKLIEFKTQLAETNAKSEAAKKAAEENIKNIKSAAATSVENTRAALEKIMSMFPTCETSDADTVEFKAFEPVAINNEVN